jgi:hypothetical protein
MTGIEAACFGTFTRDAEHRRPTDGNGGRQNCQRVISGMAQNGRSPLWKSFVAGTLAAPPDLGHLLFCWGWGGGFRPARVNSNAAWSGAAPGRGGPTRASGSGARSGLSE